MSGGISFGFRALFEGDLPRHRLISLRWNFSTQQLHNLFELVQVQGAQTRCVHLIDDLRTSDMTTVLDVLQPFSWWGWELVMMMM